MAPSADHSPLPQGHPRVPALESSTRACPSADTAATPRLGLSTLDRLAAGSLIADDDITALLELVRASAESLAHTESRERDGARVRLLSRAIATAKAQLDLLTTEIGARWQAGDEHGAVVADKLALGAARRLQILCGEHRACSLAERQPSVVAIGRADHVRIDPGR